jgi:PII-like signaling protein
MQGFQIVFFTQQDRLHGHLPLAQWLLEEARRLGIRGATVSGGIQGLGHDGAVHAINMFDLSDQPIQIMLVVNELELRRLSERLEQEQVHVFFMKTQAEFGTLGKDRSSLCGAPLP